MCEMKSLHAHEERELVSDGKRTEPSGFSSNGKSSGCFAKLPR